MYSFRVYLQTRNCSEWWSKTISVVKAQASTGWKLHQWRDYEMGLTRWNAIQGRIVLILEVMESKQHVSASLSAELQNKGRRTGRSSKRVCERYYGQALLTTISCHRDVSIPEGCLYFSLPCFGGVSNLSTKEGIVSVRQMGWHTGWRREESRIIGTVYASPIEIAIKRDKF